MWVKFNLMLVKSNFVWVKSNMSVISNNLHVEGGLEVYRHSLTVHGVGTRRLKNKKIQESSKN